MSSKQYKSPLRYPGGKSKLADKIVREFSLQGAVEYREPMVGGASVFLEAKSIGFAQRYRISDCYAPLIDFLVSAKYDNEKLRNELTALRNSLVSVDDVRAHYEQEKLRGFSGGLRIDNAVPFFFLNRVTFSGTIEAGGFSKDAAQNRFTYSAINRIANLQEPLHDTFITTAEYASALFDPGEDVFVFLDPPYLTAQKLYGKRGQLHSIFDHNLLAERLKRTKHKWLMTIDDCEEIRELYKDFKIKPFNVQYGMSNSNGAAKVGKELFISNY